MLYRADPFQIDLLIESQASGRSLVITDNCWIYATRRSLEMTCGSHFQTCVAA
jgi:hypothetical protein